MEILKGEMINAISNEVVGYGIYAKTKKVDVEYDDKNDDVIVYRIKGDNKISLKELEKMRVILKKEHKEANKKFNK